MPCTTRWLHTHLPGVGRPFCQQPVVNRFEHRHGKPVARWEGRGGVERVVDDRRGSRELQACVAAVLQTSRLRRRSLSLGGACTGGEQPCHSRGGRASSTGEERAWNNAGSRATAAATQCRRPQQGQAACSQQHCGLQ